MCTPFLDPPKAFQGFSWSVLLRIPFMPAEDYEKLPAGTVEAHKVSEAGEERYVLDAIIGEATWWGVVGRGGGCIVEL